MTRALRSSVPAGRVLFVATAIYFGATLFVVSPAFGEESPRQSTEAKRQKTKIVATQADVDQWVADLKHDEYEIRERAQRRLQKVGKAAVRPLIQGVQSSDPEVSWRCGEILQYLSLHGDDATIAALSQEASKAATTSQHSGLHALVNDMTYRRQERRHHVVKTRLQSLGAHVIDSIGFEGDFVPDGGPARLMAVDADDPFEEVTVEPALEAVDEPDAPAAVDEDPFGKESPKNGGDEAIGEEAIVEEPTAPPAEVEVPVEVPAEPDAPTLAEAPDAPLPGGEVLDGKDLDGEEIEVDAELERKDVDLDKGLEDFDLFKKEGIERAEPKTEIEVLEAADVIVLRGFAGGFGGVAGVIDVEGNGTLLVDANFKGEDRDLKDAKDLMEITDVKLHSPSLSDESLKYVVAMPQLRRVEVAHGSFTTAGMQAFRKARPDAIFFAKGKAILGINGNTDGGPCRIQAVSAPSGAADAGLQPGDEIIEVDGEGIETFADLTIKVFPHKPGEKIKVVYLRDGKRSETAILLRARAPGQ